MEKVIKKTPRREGRTLVTLGEKWRILFIINIFVEQAIFFIIDKLYSFQMTCFSPTPMQNGTYIPENKGVSLFSIELT
jgi:hypothetical protein